MPDEFFRHAALKDIKQEIENWTTKYGVYRYSQKTIKNTHRLGFDQEEYFSLFTMTWMAGVDDCPQWLRFQLVNIANERY